MLFFMKIKIGFSILDKRYITVFFKVFDKLFDDNLNNLHLFRRLSHKNSVFDVIKENCSVSFFKCIHAIYDWRGKTFKNVLFRVIF